MPVYINTNDNLKDFFEREVKANNYYFDPMILSEWVYGYRGDTIIEEYYPELMSLLKKVTRAVPEATQADIITELISVANKSFDENYSERYVNKKHKQWIDKYLQEQ
tara:strand:- start:607 stop:927 length:321 start_codon:yes stop_codon:yes gene_type:complete